MSLNHDSFPLTPFGKRMLENPDLPAVLYQQYKPTNHENIISLNELNDPVGDEAFEISKGFIHRYDNKVLLKVTDTCDAYCRFCFRKDMIANGNGILSEENMAVALKYIKETPVVNEIIISGGDPLTLSNRRIKKLIGDLSSISTLKTIRFHTRTPIIKPSRIDDEFINILKSYPKQIIMVLHINHANEMTIAVVDKILKLRQRSILLKSQSVLLKSINDNVEALENLIRTISQLGIQPYYLHHLDKAHGTRHFHVPIERGSALMQRIKSKSPELDMPVYVLDLPEGHGKIAILSSNVENIGNNNYRVTDRKGRIHHYEDIAI